MTVDIGLVRLVCCLRLDRRASLRADGGPSPASISLRCSRGVNMLTKRWKRDGPAAGVGFDGSSVI